MKKVFLFLSAATLSFATMAGNEWDVVESGGTYTIDIAYNSYGSDKDEDGTADQFQAGNTGILADAVFEANGNSAWTPAVGEKFLVTMKGTVNTSAKVQAFLVDEREEVSYWAALNDGCAEFDLVKDVAFDQSFVLTITNVTSGEIDLTAPGLVFGIVPTVTSSMAGFDNSTPVTFTLSDFSVSYQEAIDYENPLYLDYKGAADEAADGYKYQGTKISAVTAAANGQYANVSISFKATEDISTIMFGLIDAAPEAGFWKELTDGMVSFAANLTKGSSYSYTFSIPVVADPTASAVFTDAILAQSQKSNLFGLVLDNISISVTVSDTKLYDEPSLAVENVEANVAIEGGVVYSAGEIVVYNTLGQVVATASQEFNINSLEAGVYFVSTQEGTAKIVK